MNTDEAIKEFKRIFQAYPSYRQWLESATYDDEDPRAADKTLTAWCEMLSGCDAADVSSVVDRVVSGDLEAVTRYEKPDVLPRRIKTEANEQRAKRRDRETQARKYHGHSKGAWGAVSRDKTGHIAIDLGAMVRTGELTSEESKRRTDELVDVWDKGGAEPEWLAEMFGRKHASPFNEVPK